MPRPIRQRLAAGVALAALVAAGGVAAVSSSAAAAPTPTAPDYFAENLPGVRENSVFEAVTFERFERLLGSAGTYAFLIGGPADPSTRAAAAHIDAVAEEYGVEAVYTFDPRLDGKDVDIRSFGSGEAGAQLRALYTRLVTDYLNKDTTPQFGNGSDPYLFVYDKDRRVGEAEDRIVASLGGTVTAAQLAGEGAVANYRDDVADVFDAVAVEGVAALDTASQFDFFGTAVNAKHVAQYGGGASYGSADILTADDGADFRLQSLTYPELVHLLDSDANSTILFGGTWCHNTRAVIKDVNRAARESGTETVYVFDLRLDGASSNNLHIRDSASALSYLYGDLVAKYLPNLRTQYELTSPTPSHQVTYRPGGDQTAALASARKLQVPYLIQYEPARTLDGAPAPVAKDWIRSNANGTFTEYMTEWWWVNHVPAQARNGEAEDARLVRQANAWAFADEAIAKIDGFFGLATAPSAPARPAVSANGSDITVTWTAPATGGAAITGYRVSLDGAAPIVVDASVQTYTFTGLPAGSHSVTVTAVNHIGASEESAAASVTVVPPSTGPEPTTSPSPTASPAPLPETGGPAKVSVSVTGDVEASGTIRVSGSGVSPSASVRVELHSTPVVLGSTTATASGAFALTATIPASTTPGAHSIVVFVDGVEVARTAITVAGSLPATGGTSVPLVVTGLGIALILAGAVSIVSIRRRHFVA